MYTYSHNINPVKIPFCYTAMKIYNKVTNELEDYKYITNNILISFLWFPIVLPIAFVCFLCFMGITVFANAILHPNDLIIDRFKEDIKIGVILFFVTVIAFNMQKIVSKK
ncbi:hypothetical protein Catovirus_1_221 [Catovirus CTV1]|uniref:Uncharacterized protein n=1 Tax=Catovirus CTV1 TaxID=1977631 RepID=A0A1V0S8Z9_9VIRU|nr:hypothetical protein Catovirus_1_221 [Catovirus CTV1]